MTTQYLVLLLAFVPACGGASFTAGSESDVTESDSGVAVPGAGGAVTPGTGGVTQGYGGAGGSEDGAGGAHDGTGGAPQGGTGSGGIVTAGGAHGSGGSAGGDAGTGCGTALPGAFAWQEFSECDPPVVNGGLASTAGSKCDNAPCASDCSLTWGSATAATDGVDVAFTASCSAAAHDGYNFCDARWASLYAVPCLFGVSGAGTVHFPTVGLAAVTGGVWSASATNSCQFFSVSSAADALNAAVAAAAAGARPRLGCN